MEMTSTYLADKAAVHLRTLCHDIPGRAVGSAGNRAATRFFAGTIAAYGFDVTTPSFDCIDWVSDSAALGVDGVPFAVLPSPYSLGGDFDIASVHMTEEEGVRLANYAGHTATLSIQAQRLPSSGCNVVATRGGDGRQRVVLFAHIDAKAGTPGAIDNAAGVTVLLLVAELMAGYAGSLGVEIVALNGEDYYSNPGEMLYLRQNAGRFDEIVLGINIDGAGYRQGATAFSLYDCPTELAGLVRQVLAQHAGIVEGEPWYQGDHFLFLMHQRPALAITSAAVAELLGEIVHTEKDTLAIVDPARLVAVAEALAEVVGAMSLVQRIQVRTTNAGS